MKKIVLIYSVLLSLVLTGVCFGSDYGAMNLAPSVPATANTSRFYMSWFGGLSKPTGSIKDESGTKQKMKTQVKKSFNAGAALGYQLTGDLPIRLQVSGSFYSLKEKKSLSTSGDVAVVATVLSVMYDFKFGQFDMYPGLGVGWGQFTWKPTGGANQQNSGMVFDAVAGMGYQFNDNFSMDLEYEALANSIKNDSGTNKIDAHGILLHSLRLVMRFNFV